MEMVLAKQLKSGISFNLIKQSIKKSGREGWKMLSQAKVLYQVKLILDYLPEEEYKLIPQEMIDYIEDNFEYDENFSIDPEIPLEKQKIDDKAFEMLDKIVRSAEITKKENKSIKNAEIDSYF